MANKMLIDASHPEETRVVVVRGQKVEEFDFESANRKQLRGNIYLAKVTRVEPSLQAAFVEYGGNRHGFLAFSEIHPDYYQIPVADRQALLEAEAEAAARGGAGRGAPQPRPPPPPSRSAGRRATSRVSTAAEAGTEEKRRSRSPERNRRCAEGAGDDRDTAASDRRTPRLVMAEDPASGETAKRLPSRRSKPRPDIETARCRDRAGRRGSGSDRGPHARRRRGSRRGRGRRRGRRRSDVEEHEIVEQLGGDALEEVPERPRATRKQYKIQEVIKRRQILLVQVVKEERGNKGAALTTYLSLAGRYSVLMPNTGRGGGISRKITNAADRKRLKEIAQELEVPEGMGIILRTAGASRTKAEIKRDYEYLMRLWESVRELTLSSAAPCPRLRGGLADQARHPRPLQQGHRRRDGRRRGRLPRGQGLHAHAHAEPCQAGPALPRAAAALREIRHRSPARRHVLERTSP